MPNYRPTTLFNPKGEVVEVMSRGQIIIFQPGEKKLVEGVDAYHLLQEVNCGLVEYDGQDSNPKELPLNDMPWRELVSLGSKLGVFKPPMNKEQLIAVIKEVDEQETGTLQEPAGKEEA